MPGAPSAVGPYRIERELGRGGMGVVYQARDTRLDRAVAIKSLPDELAFNEARLLRFEREARLLASLSHPNIAGVYGLEELAGAHYLVMELVEGETLSTRLSHGPMPLDEALPAAAQIAAALEAAHEKGVIHRDIKPGNIMLRADGTIKVLDFGLARTQDPPEAGSTELILDAPTRAPIQSPTIPGAIMGTAGYMSPEQARGRTVDRRSDIFSFGCVLFEMLSGKQPFAGESVHVSISATLHLEPDWAELPANTPPHVRRLLQRCLAKDPRERLRDIGDARLELAASLSEPRTLSSPARPRRRRPGWSIVFGAALLAALAGALAREAIWARPRSRATSTAAPTHLSFGLPEDPDHARPVAAGMSMAITPDGRRIVFVATSGAGVGLFQRRLEDPDATYIAPTARDGALFTSPDGRWVAFESSGRIVKTPLSGGNPTPVCTVTDQTRGGCWLDDGTMVVSRSIEGGLWRVNESGGEPTALTQLDTAAGELSHRWPAALPGARGVLFVVKTARLDSFDDADIWALDLKSGERKRLVSGGCAPHFWPDTPKSGLLIYSRHDHLWAARLDLPSLTLTAVPLDIWPDVPDAPDDGSAVFAVASDAGTLAYLRADRSINQCEPVWVDPATGKATSLGVAPNFFDAAAVGPSGEIAVSMLAANDYIALIDDRGVMRRLTHGYNLTYPIWNPAGDTLLASDDHGRVMSIPIADPDRITPVKGLDHGEKITSWSPDGKLMLCTRTSEETRGDIYLIHADGSTPPEPILATVEHETDAVFSPDGTRIAYASTQNGPSQVFIRPFPGPGAVQQVSIDGGARPLWSSDGTSLYFRRDTQLLTAQVPVAARPGAPRILFTGNYLWNRVLYLKAAPETKLLMMRPATTSPPRLDVVLNWADDVKRKIDAAKP